MIVFILAIEIIPMVLDTSKEILQKGYVCDNCLGRQFAQLLSGFTNRERGCSIRIALAMEYSIKPFPIDKANFSGLNFRKKIQMPDRHEPCKTCSGLFENLDKWAGQAEKKLAGIECRTFVVSTMLSRALVQNEESLWEDIGIEHCEPIKSEVNRELGKLIAEKTGKEPDESNPDVAFILDLEKNALRLQINPVYVYGRYRKLVRGIPQTKWEMYKETVEDIIAKPFMRESGGSGHSLHASGREDIDARCLAWRPFVLEIESPKKRGFQLAKMEAEIGRTKKVAVSGMRYSDRMEVVKVKSSSFSLNEVKYLNTNKSLMKKEILSDALISFYQMMGKHGIIPEPRIYETKTKYIPRSSDFIVFGGASLVLQDALLESSDIDIIVAGKEAYAHAIAKTLNSLGIPNKLESISAEFLDHLKFNLGSVKFDLMDPGAISHALSSNWENNTTMKINGFEARLRPVYDIIGDFHKAIKIAKEDPLLDPRKKSEKIGKYTERLKLLGYKIG